ncbi:hypothetical protein EVAR_24087_1 [Eumeta japonica]|uniref:Uncharacterized protein n=1 Tax=Eumeta variegata TaxID=151549 RepID=A0A4C1ZWU0_EUMVA|nr:hypothetical protein EVAR_24087_1 [Eumeta japonica]
MSRVSTASWGIRYPSLKTIYIAIYLTTLTYAAGCWYGRASLHVDRSALLRTQRPSLGQRNRDIESYHTDINHQDIIVSALQELDFPAEYARPISPRKGRPGCQAWAYEPGPTPEAIRDAYAAVRVTLRRTAPDLVTRDRPAPTVKAHIRPVTAASRPDRENGSPQWHPDYSPDHHRSTIDIDGTRPINGDDRTPPPYGCHRTSDKSAQPIRAVSRGKAHCGGKTKEKAEKGATPTPASPPRNSHTLRRFCPPEPPADLYCAKICRQ